jgi:hypothetical protein
MDGANGRSIVRWQNLLKAEGESEGGSHDE